MNKISVQYYSSPMGELILGDFNGQLCLCDWRYRKLRDKIDERLKSKLNAVYDIEKSLI